MATVHEVTRDEAPPQVWSVEDSRQPHAGGVGARVTELEEQFRQFVAEVEPLVARTAPMVGVDRAFLGWLCDLLPSRTCSAQQLTMTDWAWLAALERVVHAYQLSYELITFTGEEDTLWLVPLH
jgi:hypothetical protein